MAEQEPTGEKDENVWEIGVTEGGRFGVAMVEISDSKPPIPEDIQIGFQVRTGEIEVTFEGKTRRIKAGEGIDIPEGVDYQIMSLGDEPAEVIVLTSPAWNPDDQLGD